MGGSGFLRGVHLLHWDGLATYGEDVVTTGGWANLGKSGGRGEK